MLQLLTVVAWLQLVLVAVDQPRQAQLRCPAVQLPKPQQRRLAQLRHWLTLQPRLPGPACQAAYLCLWLGQWQMKGVKY